MFIQIDPKSTKDGEEKVSWSWTGREIRKQVNNVLKTEFAGIFFAVLIPSVRIFLIIKAEGHEIKCKTLCKLLIDKTYFGRFCQGVLKHTETLCT